MVQCPKCSTFDPNFNFNLRRDYQKIFYERRAHESVDEKSLCWVMSRKYTKVTSIATDVAATSHAPYMYFTTFYISRRLG